MEVVGRCDSAKLEQRGRQIHVQDEIIDANSGASERWVEHNEGNADRFFVRPSLVAKAVLSVEKAVVARQHDRCPFDNAFFFEHMHNLTDALVHGRQKT